MRRRAVLLLTVTMALLGAVTSPAWADTFVVNSTGDDGDQSPSGVCNTAPFPPGTEPECTLRAAIEEANATTAADFITFNIPASGVQTISPATLLPIITAPVIIDGYTQPGASPNTLAVGNNADLRIRLDRGSGSAASGLWIDANDSVVRGLSITGFSSGVGVIVSGDNNTVEGNFIGIDPSGTLAGVGNFTGVSVSGNSSNNLVGGGLPAARNVISGNGREGVRINTNPPHGGNRVQGNYIGTTKSGTGDLGNTTAGVIDNSFGDSKNLIGGTTPAAANTIAFNGGDGVQVGDGFVPVGISILGNSIFANDDRGIDLGGNGVTANDDKDPDTGANNLQNYPVVTTARPTQKRVRGKRRKFTTIAGTLNSTPNTSFTVQLFRNASGEDEGRTLLTQFPSVTTDTNGNASFGIRVGRSRAPVGSNITATATNNSTGDTSEFSVAKRVG